MKIKFYNKPFNGGELRSGDLAIFPKDEEVYLGLDERKTVKLYPQDGGIEEAPEDGEIYGRKDAGWFNMALLDGFYMAKVRGAITPLIPTVARDYTESSLRFFPEANNGVKFIGVSTSGFYYIDITSPHVLAGEYSGISNSQITNSKTNAFYVGGYFYLINSLSNDGIYVYKIDSSNVITLVKATETGLGTNIGSCATLNEDQSKIYYTGANDYKLYSVDYPSMTNVISLSVLDSYVGYYTMSNMLKIGDYLYWVYNHASGVHPRYLFKISLLDYTTLKSAVIPTISEYRLVYDSVEDVIYMHGEDDGVFTDTLTYDPSTLSLLSSDTVFDNFTANTNAPHWRGGRPTEDGFVFAQTDVSEASTIDIDDVTYAYAGVDFRKDTITDAGNYSVDFSSRVVGDGSATPGVYSFAHGQDTYTTYDNSTVFGMFNTDVNALLTIGNGVDDLNRANAFVVYKDGKIEMDSLPTASPGGSGILWNDAGVVKIT